MILCEARRSPEDIPAILAWRQSRRHLRGWRHPSRVCVWLRTISGKISIAVPWPRFSQDQCVASFRHHYRRHVPAGLPAIGDASIRSAARCPLQRTGRRPDRPPSRRSDRILVRPGGFRRASVARSPPGCACGSGRTSFPAIRRHHTRRSSTSACPSPLGSSVTPPTGRSPA